MKTAGIVGLGLIGGSLARDLAAGGWRVLADDVDPGTLSAARAAGVVDAALEPSEIASLDLLVLAVPVRAAPGRIREIGRSLPPGSDVVITDVGSTKRSAAAAARDAGLASRFVGSHPMAGSHQSGWSASRTGLFDGSPVWICPSDTATEGAVIAVEQLWVGVGARPTPSTADAHDRLMARVSHLPQAAATAVANLLAAQHVDPRHLGPGGRDTTRLAASDPHMWTDILLDNADHVAPLLADLADEIATLRALIRNGDPEPLQARIASGRTWSRTP